MENIVILNKKALKESLNNEIMSCDKCYEQPCPI